MDNFLEEIDTEVPGRASYVDLNRKKEVEKRKQGSLDLRKSKSMQKKDVSPADAVITAKVFIDLNNKFPKLKMRLGQAK
jgi:hypothetical protein